MSHDLDRFRLARSNYDASAPLSVPAPPPRRALVPLEQLKPAREREPVIHSTRGPKFVDHATCPMCGTTREGITYQGMRASGAKIHELAAHSPGYRSVRPKEPRCLGSGMRMAFVDGQWVGEARP